MSELGGDGLDVPSALWGFHDRDSTHLAKLQDDADQVQDRQQAFHHSDGPEAATMQA